MMLMFDFVEGTISSSLSHNLWEIRYICLLWLSLIAMIPFDLNSIDSGNSSKSLLSRLFALSSAFSNVRFEPFKRDR